MITTQLIINLLLILTVAWILGSLFSRFGLPVMLGELLAGVILGPPLLGLVTASPSLELMAEMGIFFVMFYTGMEMDARELLEHIWPSMAVAVGGFVVPFVLGYFVTRMFGGTVFQALFVGMGISVTAIAVQSIVLNSMRINKTSIGHIIIGAAIIDDILSLIALSVLLGLAKTGTVIVTDLGWIILKVIAFFGLTIILGHFVIPRFTKHLHDREGKGFTFAFATALVMAYFAELAGLHLIIGAFLAGQFVRKEIMDESIYLAIKDRFYGIAYGFLVPIFFVSLSFHLHFEMNVSFMLFTLALIFVAVASKLVGSGLGAALFRRNFWDSVVVGFGMNGRGAVEMVIAVVVINLSNELMKANTISEPLLTETQFSALILMAFITTLMAPLTLKWAAMRACQADEKATFCQLWENSLQEEKL
ncbi:cation:proton antiporter [candidate division CSSED10-310 bacterium]|uniref:Cation:proton antiporter n=1 Tax=candidate division CSSED10-310 bacterium TaxID=2855610 RepID=A0ABV6YUS6_UNCC1